MIDIDLYFSKIPHSIEDVMPGKNKLITCLNSYSYYVASKSDIKYEEFDYIATDGFLVQILYNLIHKNRKAIRISVDMTSLVPLIFNYAIAANCSIYFLGAKQHEIEQFYNIIKSSFPQLAISGYRNGYFNSMQERLDVLKEIVQIEPNIIFIGTGTPLQDQMALELKALGYEGTVYTCGGFIHQTQNNINYYPAIINKLNLRFLYRLFKEKGIWKRYYPYLFVFLYQYIRYIVKLLS
jgi:N-acetylglucosaminyldiphosphoundecaprenol N-acetyl-beta-D-mannosaminyltransferase